MFEMGFAVALGLLVIFVKTGWRVRIWLLSHPVTVDLAVFLLLVVLHWGTFSGVMVATIGALIVSLVMSFGRWLFGYRINGTYVPGKVRVAY